MQIPKQLIPAGTARIVGNTHEDRMTSWVFGIKKKNLSSYIEAYWKTKICVYRNLPKNIIQNLA